MIRFFLLFFCLIYLSGCSGTDVQTDRAYNALGRSVHLNLKNDGYIIGIEKKYREEVGNPQKGYPDRYKELSKEKSKNAKEIEKRNIEFINATHDPKAMIVTQIKSFFNESVFIYNAYKEYNNAKINYEEGYKSLEFFKKDLVDKLLFANENGHPYSHIFVMSMGWNNDQHESIWRYNKIMNNMKMMADKDFKPLVICFTWPSVWKSIESSWIKKKLAHLFSYGVKSNDSDEIGYTTANWLINRLLPQVKNSYPDKQFPLVVGIGHSMGARLISRAIFSEKHLKADKPFKNYKNNVDLFIGLQGAFSANRFIKGKGKEGWPYSDYDKLSTKIILTSSINDKANPVARYFTGAKHVGGKFGLKAAKNHPKIFKIITWPNQKRELKGSLSVVSKIKQVIMIDASSIVKGTNEKSAHNDILDKNMAELLWFCIKNLNNSDQQESS